MAVTLPDLLNEQHTLLDLRSRNRDEALREIVEALSQAGKVREPEKFFAEVRLREEQQTTFAGNGVAFPHARTDLLRQIVLGIGRSRDGVLFGPNVETAHLVFVIGVPRRMVTDYLVCVGALARITKDAANREALMSMETPAEFVDLLREKSLLLE